MKYLISLNFKCLSIKMNWEKLIFHWQKLNFKLIEHFVATTEYLSLGKILPAKLYLKVKVCTNLITVRNLLCFRNNFIWIFLFNTSIVKIE